LPAALHRQAREATVEPRLHMKTAVEADEKKPTWPNIGPTPPI
jgi:hypothetical protein